MKCWKIFQQFLKVSGGICSNVFLNEQSIKQPFFFSFWSLAHYWFPVNPYYRNATQQICTYIRLEDLSTYSLLGYNNKPNLLSPSVYNSQFL